jgi:exopolyphosphatase / guanosine-5'-triphosphate,3'-diphosphate pyrophosphatase
VAIVPRWEWRTFGERFGPAEEAFDALTPERAEESDETYVLSTQSDASAKIRAGLMDVKHLDTVNGDGLEQWRPVMKAEFPVPAADVGAVLAELGVSLVLLERDAYSLPEFVEDVVPRYPELRAVDVHKQRAHFTIGGAMAELSELTVDGRTIGTIAIEGEDPDAVISVVRDLRLADRVNTCMARMLKAFVGLG